MKKRVYRLVKSLWRRRSRIDVLDAVDLLAVFFEHGFSGHRVPEIAMRLEDDPHVGDLRRLFTGKHA